MSLVEVCPENGQGRIVSSAFCLSWDSEEEPAAPGCHLTWHAAFPPGDRLCNTEPVRGKAGVDRFPSTLQSD